MEYSNHGGSSDMTGGTASGSSSKVSFFYLPPAPGTNTGATVAAPPPAAGGTSSVHHHEFRNYYQTLKAEGAAAAAAAAGPSQYTTKQREAAAAAAAHHDQVNVSNGDMERIKAKIMCHPQYSSLLAAYLECQKVGAPQDVIDRLTVIGSRLDSRSSPHRRESSSDPELDQFMEAYCNMLVKYREELTRPIQEATDFLKRVESQLSSLTNGSTALLLSSDGKNDGAASSEDEQEASDGEGDAQGIDPRAEEKELKYQLLKKYSGYISSLRQEFSKKKKKGKLPKEARQKLLSWWELHYKWPYPSESEKIALAEATGLDQKQINNWFINQRKRHWKPSEDMQFFVMDGYHHPNTAGTLFLDGHAQFAGTDGLYRLGS